MKINEYNQMMAYLIKPDKKPVTPKSKPKKSTREAYKEYLEIRPFLDAESQMFIEKELGFAMGGSVETPKRGLVDGPGSYSQKKVIGANQATGILVDIDLFNTVIDDYEELVQSAFNKGDLSKIESFREYSKKRLPKRYKQLVGSIQRKNVRNPKNILFDKKNELLRKLIKQANDGERYVSQLDILKKVSDIPVRKEIGREENLKARGFKDLGQWVDKDLPKLESREKKVMKVFNDIIKNDRILELKDPNWKFIKTAKTGEEYKVNLLNKIIGERANVNSVKIVRDAISKHPEMKKKKFNEIFKYMTRAHVDDFEGYKFSDAFEYASERRGGASKFKNVDTMQMYKNPDVNIMNYALRHWDGNNFNELKSRIEFFDKKTGKPIKWKSGLRLNPKNVYFTLDGDPMKWDTRSLKTQGKQSGLFDDVYRTTNEFQRLKGTPVPDGKGGTKPFGEVIGKANLAIGHNAKGGVKASPFKNLQLQTQKMNTALFNATNFIKNKDLQNRVVREIYGDLYNVTGDDYLKKFLSSPPDVDYKEAGKRIIMNPKIDISKFSPAKQQELLRVATGKKIQATGDMSLEENLKVKLAALGCPTVTKATGGRIGFQTGATPTAQCIARGAEKINFGNIKPGSEARNATQFLKGAYKLGRNVVKFGVIPEAMFVTGESLLRMGLGDTKEEAFLRASEYLLPGNQTEKANILRDIRTLNPETASIIVGANDYKKALENLKNVRTNTEIDIQQNDPDFTGITNERLRDIQENKIKQAEQNIKNKFQSEAVTDFAAMKEAESQDIAKSQAFFPKFVQKARDSQIDSDIETIAAPEIKQKKIAAPMLTIDDLAFGAGLDRDTLDTYRTLSPDINKAVLGELFSSGRANLANQERLFGTSGLFFGQPISQKPAYDFAGGGIAKLAGKSSGPPPESGPTPQGLDFLMKRGR